MPLFILFHSRQLGEESVQMQDLAAASAFLSSLLHNEFVRKDVPGLERNVEALKSLVICCSGLECCSGWSRS